MTEKFKKQLFEIINNNREELIAEWLQFFEECVEANLDIKSDEAQAMQHFLIKLKEIIGEEEFFNFQDSVYTCFLKFPIYKLLEQKGLFISENILPMTHFFEAMTSHIMLDFVSKNKAFQNTSTKELAEREAPMSEIWEGVFMVSIVGTLDSQRILEIIDKVLDYLQNREDKHVIIDIGSIFDVNSEVTNQLMQLNNAIRFMGAYAYITGVTANIAKSLTHLDISLGDIKTYATTKQAVQEIVTQN